MALKYVDRPSVQVGTVYLFKDPTTHKTVWKPGRVTKLVKISGAYWQEPMVEWFDENEPEVFVLKKASVAEVDQKWVVNELKIAEAESTKWANRLNLLNQLRSVS
jgi:hypothetical protein